MTPVALRLPSVAAIDMADVGVWSSVLSSRLRQAPHEARWLGNDRKRAVCPPRRAQGHVMYRVGTVSVADRNIQQPRVSHGGDGDIYASFFDSLGRVCVQHEPKHKRGRQGVCNGDEDKLRQLLKHLHGDQQVIWRY